MAGTAIRLELLPARLGDCLLVECPPADGGRPWRMLVDGGPPDCWSGALRARLESLPADDRRLDVVVVSHVDSDHIGGIIPLFREDGLGLAIGDVWFNGRDHLPDPAAGVGGGSRSIKQGHELTTELVGDAVGSLPWNRVVDGGPLTTGEDDYFVELPTPPGGPRLTLLSPTDKRLLILADKWDEWLDEARRGAEEEEAPAPPPPPLGDLAALAAAPSTTDRSAPNGSSIALLVEHRGASCVLAADAFGSVLGAALVALARSRGLDSLPVDAVKAPHHGSRNNVPGALVRAVPATHWLFSSNGDRFGHPDDIALARVVTESPPGVTLWFNYRNERTLRWDDADLRSAHGHRTRYPDSSAGGIVLELEAR